MLAKQPGGMFSNKEKKIVKSPKLSFTHELKKNKILFIMLIPAVIYIIIFNYVPLFGLIVAFKRYNHADGIFFSPWVGLDNFRFFFISGKAWIVTRNTLIFNVIFIVCNVIFDVSAAILISEMKGKYFKKLCQSFMFLPFFMSWVVVATIVYNIFNYEYGILNTIMKGMGKDPVDIYNQASMWYFLLPLFNIWKSIGYNSILYLSSIMGINPEISQAAEIDGANIFQRIRHVTLPHITPTIIIMVLLSIGRILRGNFEMFYQLVGTATRIYDTTDIIDTYVFRSMISGSDFGMVSAAGFYQSVLCFIIIVSVNRIVKRIKKDYALF